MRRASRSILPMLIAMMMVLAPATACALDFAFSGPLGDALVKLAAMTGFPAKDAVWWAHHKLLRRVAAPRCLLKKVTINATDAHLPAILAELGKQAGVGVNLREGYLTVSQVGQPLDASGFVEVGDYLVRASKETYEGDREHLRPPPPANQMIAVTIEIWADTLRDGWQLAGVSDHTRLVCGNKVLHALNDNPSPGRKLLHIGTGGAWIWCTPTRSPISIPRSLNLLFRPEVPPGAPAVLKGDLMAFREGPWSADIPVREVGKPKSVGPASVVLRRFSQRADYVSISIKVPPTMTPGAWTTLFCNVVGVTPKGAERTIDTVIATVEAAGTQPRELPARHSPYSPQPAGRNEKIEAVRVRLWWIAPENAKPIGEFAIPVKL